MELRHRMHALIGALSGCISCSLMLKYQENQWLPNVEGNVGVSLRSVFELQKLMPVNEQIEAGKGRICSFVADSVTCVY